MSGLLDQPHHDGSALYVSDLAPRLGDTVRVRVRVPTEGGYTRVHVRTTPDAEQRFVRAEVERADAVETWWAADLRLVNPVTSYRFVLEGGPTQYAWLNGAGLWPRDVPDASDFRIVADAAAPPWVRDAVVYQIFPDRYAVGAPDGPAPAPPWAVPAAWTDPVDLREGHCSAQYYGGDLDGITAHLDHVADLGANVVYLTPFFPAGSTHRYDASTFDEVDPLLGGDAALARLCAAAHARGIRVMGDFTTNHTGVTHEWFTAAGADPTSPEHGFYRWQADGSPVCWYDVPTLPKLDWDSAELRRRVVDDPRGVIRRWLAAGLDGWRIDVANMTGRDGLQDRNHEVARWVREAAVDERPDALVVAEHTHDYTTDLPGDGWHGVMNYAGFMKPVWTWLRQHDREGGFLGAPVVVPALPAELVVETMRDFTSRVPWSVLTASWNLVGSHDATRVRTLVGEDSRHVDVAAAFLLTMPSTPMLTYGDEIGMEGTFGEDGRRPMPWAAQTAPDRRSGGQLWDDRLREVYRSLVAARRSSVALRGGGLRWLYAAGDAIVFLREHEDEVALVHLARDHHPAVSFPADRLPGIDTGRAAYGPSPLVERGSVRLEATAPGASIWVWRPPR